MWSDWLVFCDYGFSVSALWCPLATPTILLGFLLWWTWGISSRLLQQSPATAPYLGWGVPPHGRPSWPWTWSSSSGPTLPVQLPLFGRGVAPLGHRPWTRTWGSPSQLLLCLCSLALSVATPDLGRGVAPLSHTSVRSVLASTLLRNLSQPMCFSWCRVHHEKCWAGGSTSCLVAWAVGAAV